ncbi:MAG: hypothetical protein OEY52_02890 [Gammaproteobacteria bacterium]|nr:hypothetical protein [Gammaproteobacteria bacterium]
MSQDDRYRQDRDVLNAFKTGELIPELSAAKKAQFIQAADETLKKDKRINIRISSRDLEGLQRIALREGIPYQTLISSLLHKFVSGHFEYIGTEKKQPSIPAWRARPTRKPD